MADKTRQRTCIVCRKANSKGDLLRVVRTPEGSVAFDPSGRANGRGAYVCGVACLEKALDTHRLDAALRVKLTEEDKQRIADGVRHALEHENYETRR